MKALLVVLAMLSSNSAVGEGVACGDAADGSACTFSIAERTVTGICRTGPDGQASTCMPAPGDGALSACAAKAEGETCVFNEGAVKGTCSKAGISLACIPSRLALR